MATGGWKTPFPIRFGGSAHEPVENAYTSLRSNLGSAFSGDEDSAVDTETQAQARLISFVDAFLCTFVEQSDPMALTTMLERWENILNLGHSRSDSDTKRRKKVASRLTGFNDGTTEGIIRIADAAFSPWRVRAHYTNAEDAVMYWPGGTSHPDFDWYSTIAHLVVEYTKPDYASRDEANLRSAVCLRALDEFAPAWATFDVTETQASGPFAELVGFYLDQPNLDLSVL